MTWKSAISSRLSDGGIDCCRNPTVALVELLEEYPNADRAALTRLLDKAEKERLEQRSPVGARELFAFLRQLLG